MKKERIQTIHKIQRKNKVLLLKQYRIYIFMLLLRIVSLQATYSYER